MYACITATMAVLLGLLAVLVGTAIGLVGVRFVLCLLRVDASNRIVEVVGVITDPLVAPFENVLGIEHVAVGGEHGAADTAALVAMAGYGLVFALLWAIGSMLRRGRSVVA